jgi:hypothetical protein
MVFDHYLRYPQSMAKTFFQPDMLHPNARGHVSHDLAEEAVSPMLMSSVYSRTYLSHTSSTSYAKSLHLDYQSSHLPQIRSLPSRLPTHLSMSRSRWIPYT